MKDSKWKQIVDEAFDAEAPVHEFSKKYNDNKARMIEYGTKKGKGWNSMRIAAAVAAFLIIIPTGAYAANRAYYAFVEKTDSYQDTINIRNSDVNVGNEVATQEAFMSLELTYVPEDLQYNEDGPYGGKYTTREPSQDRGMSCEFYKMPEGGIKENVNYSEENTSWNTESGNTAIYIKRTGGWNQLWVAFANTDYVAKLYVEGFSEDEVKKLSEGAMLVASNEETAILWHEAETLTMDFGYTQKESLGELVFVGDTINWNGEKNIFATIHSLTIQDDFVGITTDGIGMHADYDSYVSEDGRIHTIRQYIKKGNGVDSLDSVADSDVVTEKVVVLKLTVTNRGDETAWVNFSPRMVRWTEEDGLGSIFYTSENYEINRVLTENLCTDGMAFSFSSNYKTNKNNIDELKAGDSAEVTLCFLVDEDMLENLYLELETNSGKEFLYMGE